MGEHIADRRGNVRRRQSGGRHLIEQGLEQMVIMLVDNGDVDRRFGERLGRRQSAKSRPDDDDLRRGVLGWRLRHGECSLGFDRVG
jgi:hypothetical protein